MSIHLGVCVCMSFLLSSMDGTCQLPANGHKCALLFLNQRVCASASGSASRN